MFNDDDLQECAIRLIEAEDEALLSNIAYKRSLALGHRNLVAEDIARNALEMRERCYYTVSEITGHSIETLTILVCQAKQEYPVQWKMVYERSICREEDARHKLIRSLYGRLQRACVLQPGAALAS